MVVSIKFYTLYSATGNFAMMFSAYTAPRSRTYAAPFR